MFEFLDFLLELLYVVVLSESRAGEQGHRAKGDDDFG
jgi:hypothetical protein